MAKKYRQGRIITSIDELAQQEFIYIRGKTIHKSWFMNWQLRYVLFEIEQGRIRYAIKVEKGENEDATLAL